MVEWLILESFYNGLTMIARAHPVATAGGAFLDLTIAKAMALVEKMVFNQGWSEERHHPRMRGTHTVKETNMLAAKLDLLLKRMDELEKPQELMLKPVQALSSHLMCEVCGNDEHSGNDYPETREDVTYMNNNKTVSFNKMIETQLAQISIVVHVSEPRKILGQLENVSEVSGRWGNPS
uniref:Uncharacterized protein n=1 Tax=Setaria italica TaxID=4555 RepID=K3YDB5_SETIT